MNRPNLYDPNGRQLLSMFHVFRVGHKRERRLKWASGFVAVGCFWIALIAARLLGKI